VVAARNPSLPPPQPPSPPQPPATPGTQVTSSGVRRFPPRADIRPYSTTASGGIPFCEWYPSSGCVNNPQALRIDSYQNPLTNRRSETPATCGLSDTVCEWFTETIAPCFGSGWCAWCGASTKCLGDEFCAGCANVTALARCASPRPTGCVWTPQTETTGATLLQEHTTPIFRKTLEVRPPLCITI
jgi:hypothetical protein